MAKMAFIEIDNVFYQQIQQVCAAKGMKPHQFIARAIGGELSKKSNQAILRPKTAGKAQTANAETR